MLRISQKDKYAMYIVQELINQVFTFEHLIDKYQTDKKKKSRTNKQKWQNTKKNALCNRPTPKISAEDILIINASHQWGNPGRPTQTITDSI